MAASDREDDTTQEILLSASWDSNAEALSIVVLSGPLAGRFIKVPREGGVIGRDPDVEISLPDPGISRRHARLKKTSKGFSLFDLQSRYGIFVDGQRLKSHTIRDGDRVQLSGETTIRIRYQDPKEIEILDRFYETSLKDKLTKVSNRRYFIRRLEQEIAYARRHRTRLTILLADLDHFKRINEEHGERVGDEVLKSVGRTLEDTVRFEDLCARYGGDEFIVLSRGFEAQDSQRFAERLRETLKRRHVQIDDILFRLTLSVGIAAFQVEDGLSLMELLARADAALHQAKRQGRDRVALWGS